jgi:hypothetical protein
VQSGTLEAATGRPRGLRREHPDGSVDASLGGGPALPVGSVAALEQPLDEHELVPAVEFHRVVTTSASASTAALRTGTIAPSNGTRASRPSRFAAKLIARSASGPMWRAGGASASWTAPRVRAL